MKSSISWTLFVLVTVCGNRAFSYEIDKVQLHNIHKRFIVKSYESFHISNITFPCNTEGRYVYGSNNRTIIKIQLSDSMPTVSSREVLTATRVSELEETDMKNILEYKGGTFIKEYLAPSYTQAASNFPDPQSLRFQQLIQDLHMRSESKITGQNRAAERYTAPVKAAVIGKRRRRKRLVLDKGDHVIHVDESCINAGEPSSYDPNYLHLCKICSAKRILPKDRYPKVLNEVFCMESDSGCLGNNNGKCVATIFNVHILKKKQNTCRLCVKDSEGLAVDEWELYTQPISVGCECMLDKNSDYKGEWFKPEQDYSLFPIG